VFIYDPIRNLEVTSYDARDAAPLSSGTRNAEPIMLKKMEEHENHQLVSLRNILCDLRRSQKQTWSSHSVLVVDMSGSMRRDDVNGARCRSEWSLDDTCT